MTPAERLIPAHAYPAGTLLRHHKGGLYRVVGHCLVEATLQPALLYTPLQGDAQGVVWMRPLDQFQDRVPAPEGAVARFTVLDEVAQAHSRASTCTAMTRPSDFS
jgi:hypothetical protein